MLQDCLRYLSGRGDLHVTAIVHKRSLCDFPGIDYIEIPWSIGSWAKRLWCEYVTMHRISRRLPETDLWFSLHDTTPRVKARRQAVYCHTSFPFMKIRRQDFRMDAKIPLFALFTKYAYRAFSRRNSYLVVQSAWMRDAMARLLPFDSRRIIVAPPAFRPMAIPETDSRQENGMTTFFYPSTPDCHKNFEVLCEASRILERSVGKGRFRVIITVNGSENRYAGWLRKQWGDVASLDFRGFLPQEELSRAYGEASCLVFPSRAETWGLPVTEFLPTGKPMLLADLPYAHETASGAPQVAFVPVSDAGILARRMRDVIDGNLSYFGPVKAVNIESPCAHGWESLFEMLMS